jgi:hypothetical protein
MFFKNTHTHTEREREWGGVVVMHWEHPNTGTELQLHNNIAFQWNPQLSGSQLSPGLLTPRVINKSGMASPSHYKLPGRNPRLDFRLPSARDRRCVSAPVRLPSIGSSPSAPVQRLPSSGSTSFSSVSALFQLCFSSVICREGKDPGPTRRISLSHALRPPRRPLFRLATDAPSAPHPGLWGPRARGFSDRALGLLAKRENLLVISCSVLGRKLRYALLNVGFRSPLLNNLFRNK